MDLKPVGDLSDPRLVTEGILDVISLIISHHLSWVFIFDFTPNQIQFRFLANLVFPRLNQVLGTDPNLTIGCMNDLRFSITSFPD